MSSDAVLVIALIAGLAALALAVYYARVVLAADPGNDRMQELSAAIREGANAFMKREYTWVAVFVVVLAILISVVLPWGAPWGSIAYIFGAVLSAGAGFVGMRIATSANSRTAEAARVGGVKRALPVAFRGGAVMGFSVAGLGLLGVTIGYLLFVNVLDIADKYNIIAAIGLGGSSIALFARVGGGIYTKAADVGADLVGKVEAGIPEDDPRNPAVIADNVGDNVGDVAGMGADLFESYVGSIVAPIAYAAIVFASSSFVVEAIVFPLAIAAVGMLAAIIGSFFVRVTGDNLAKALHRGNNVAVALTVVGTLILTSVIFGDSEGVENPFGLALAVLVGLVVGILVGKLSEIFTSDHYKTVKEIARQTETGPATVVLAGIAEGMRSAAFSVIVVAAGIAGAHAAGDWAIGEGGGIYGVAIAAIGVLSTLGITVAVDAYGPIADNAGGIAEMAHLPPEVREATDELDALGNTTAALGKGFAIGSAAVTALALFAAFTQAVGLDSIDITNVGTTVGLFIGAMFPFLFASLTINAVSRAAFRMIEEVRRQFREIPGLLKGDPDAKPEYAKAVDIATGSALREMIVPGALAVALPLVVGFIDVEALGGLLAGALVTGFLLAIFMANAGGAWDNAKKLIESGAFGGKGSEQHKAAVIGDTVGDPFKDTSGPAMNIVIKVMTIVSLIFAAAFI
ncbi:MAG: sodium-translocating pyrophosphatase [bacterium]|nr:sodium-translocating pyrophosphatase [bacterium]MDE0288464.1 sodium-translocating pyrophosphatase [bacterium]MDE0439329.1 sodium-translocating pyrophosphatase [bacterium]